MEEESLRLDRCIVKCQLPTTHFTVCMGVGISTATSIHISDMCIDAGEKKNTEHSKYFCTNGETNCYWQWQWQMHILLQCLLQNYIVTLIFNFKETYKSEN